MELFASMETMGKPNSHNGNSMDRHEDRSSRNSNSSGGSSEKIRMLDITRDKPIKVAVRVAVPVRDHPKFNFVGKLLGPKGNSMKRLQEDTMCKMAVLGRGSMKDRKKEDELRLSGDPRYSHLMEDLHVEISTFAAPAEAHARIAYALAEVRRFLVPDYHDDIRQEQMWEMQALSSTTSTTQNQSQETSDASTNSNSTSDLHSGLPPGHCMSSCANNSSNNLITNGNGACSILNNINAASFAEDLMNVQNMSQPVSCTAPQQSPGSASASPSSSSTCSSSSASNCTSSSSSNSTSSQSSGVAVAASHPAALINGGNVETTAVTTVNGAVVMHHPTAVPLNHQQLPTHLQAMSGGGVHNLIGNGAVPAAATTHRLNPLQQHHHHHQHHHQYQQHANSNTILSMAASVIAGDLAGTTPQQSSSAMDSTGAMVPTTATTVLVDPNGSLIHPALRGVKTVNIAGGMARKRPLLGVPRSTMNPTKRTVMTLLARAKNAQQMHSNRHSLHADSQPIHMISSPLILQQPSALEVLAQHNGAVQTTTTAKENILQSV